MMIIYETEYGNFGSPEDLLKYMKEEGIKEVHVTTKFVFETVTDKLNLTIQDVERWIEMGKEP